MTATRIIHNAAGTEPIVAALVLGSGLSAISDQLTDAVTIPYAHLEGFPGGGKRIRRVYTTGPGAVPVTPCGGCRQRLREFADLDVEIVSHGVDGAPLIQTLGQLLPHSFGPEFLGR